MFETQKVRRHDKFGKEWSQHENKCKSQIGQDQVSGGVRVDFRLLRKDKYDECKPLRMLKDKKMKLNSDYKNVCSKLVFF